MSARGFADVTLGFSSLADRVGAIAVPHELRHAAIVIVTQQRQGAEDTVATPSPEIAERATVIALDGIGVAKSRNEAIRSAKTRYLLFCDDDVTIDVDGLAQGIEFLRAHRAALALGRAVDETGALRKAYPDGTPRLTMFNSAKAATYEMLIDVPQVRASDVWFDERFGAGAENYLGDEYIFIADMLRAGLTAHAVPCVFGMHPADSSGARWSRDGDVDARAKALERAFGRRALVGKALFATKNRRNLGGIRQWWSFVTTRHFVP